MRSMTRVLGGALTIAAAVMVAGCGESKEEEAAGIIDDAAGAAKEAVEEASE